MLHRVAQHTYLLNNTCKKRVDLHGSLNSDQAQVSRHMFNLCAGIFAVQSSETMENKQEVLCGSNKCGGF